MVAWILWGVLGIIILLGIVALVFAKKGKKKPTDYHSLFVMGVVWVPFGIIMMMEVPDYSLGPFFFIIGWIYFVMGISHKDEWKKNRSANVIKNNWMRWILVGLLALGVAAGIVFYLGMR